MNFLKDIYNQVHTPGSRARNPRGFAQLRKEALVDEFTDASMAIGWRGALAVGAVAGTMATARLASENPQAALLAGGGFMVAAGVAGASYNTISAINKLAKEELAGMPRTVLSNGRLGPRNESLIFSKSGRQAVSNVLNNKTAMKGITNRAFGASYAGFIGGGAMLGTALGNPIAGAIGGAALGLGFQYGSTLALTAAGMRGMMLDPGHTATKLGHAINSGVGAIAENLSTWEYGARSILTGTLKNGVADNPIDAWFPFMNSMSTTKKLTKGDMLEVAREEVVDQYSKFLKKETFGSRGARKRAASVVEKELEQFSSVKDMLKGVGNTSAEAGFEIDRREVFQAIRKSSKGVDPRRFAPNPSVIKRLAPAMAIGSIAKAIPDLITPSVAPPTAHFDGRNMRHINDMGANAEYGQALLGSNSSLNVTPGSVARYAGMVF